MNENDKHDAFDKNLTGMFSTSHGRDATGFQHRLIQAVGQEVQQECRRRIRIRWLVGIAAAAAVLVAAVLTLPPGSPVDQGPIGRITKVQGVAVITNGHGPEVIDGQRDIHARQWLETRSGTTAEVLLTDQSQLTSQPRTVVQLDRDKHGHVIRLEEGAVAIAAHKQAPKRYMTVETPGTAIKVLGTKLDVRVVEPASGVRQTRVHLHSGAIEVTSGGDTALLLPGMVGITEEGKSPTVESSVLEVNDLRRLLQETRRFAEPIGAHVNMPMIIDYVNSTAWTIVPLSAFDAEPKSVFSLRLKYPAFGVKAYASDGARVDTRAEGRRLYVDLSQRPKIAGVSTVRDIVLRIPRATGLFRVNEGVHELVVPAASAESVTLLQLCLPESAWVQAVVGETIERSKRLGRQVMTIKADSEAIRIYE